MKATQVSIVFILVQIILLQGCVSTLKLDPVPKEGQQEIFQEGTETIISAKKSLVAIRPSTNTYQSVQRPTLVVSVLNGTENSFNFSTEDIEVYVSGEPVKVFTYDELVAEVKRREANAALATALSGMAQTINASNAGYTYNTGTYNYNYYGNTGYRGYGTGTYTGYTYNPSAVLQAQSAANTQMLANMTAIKTQANQSLNDLSTTMLKKSTVFPQQVHGGYITLSHIQVPEEMVNVLVKINAGGEIHEFNFQLNKVTP